MSAIENGNVPSIHQYQANQNTSELLLLTGSKCPRFCCIWAGNKHKLTSKMQHLFVYAGCGVELGIPRSGRKTRTVKLSPREGISRCLHYCSSSSHLVKFRCTSAYGRLDMSTTARLRASSKGHIAVPHRRMPFRAPSALNCISWQVRRQHALQKYCCILS